MFSHQTLFYISIFFIVSSFLLHLKEKNALSLWFIFLGGLILRFYMAHLDHFLHDWDEKFHALVARNMMDHPFKPMLYVDNIVPRDNNSWVGNHIWLHKQPLFLWQMALSMKLFGISEFAIRYPSVLLGAIMPVMLYRISFLMTNNRMISYAAAIFMCVGNYQLELISGFIGMEHNDVAFGFYILASIWAYAEYVVSKKFKYVLLIGLFAGCAVLVKWLAGMLVFGGWFFNLLYQLKNRTAGNGFKHFFVAVGIAIVVFLPWQLYILYTFPVEAAHEYAYNTLHIFQVVENHSGDSFFYVQAFRQYFGLVVWCLVIGGLIILAFSKTDQKAIQFHIIFSALVVFCFYSYVAATKMQSYVYMVGPLGFIFIAYGICRYLSTNINKYAVYLIIYLVSVDLLNHVSVEGYFHSADDPARIAKTANAPLYKTIRSKIPHDIKYIFNTSELMNIDIMFYNKGITAYDKYITEEEFNIFRKKNIPVAAFIDHGKYTIPGFMKDYPNLYLINIDMGEY